MKNYRTPRTLADATFTSGYAIVERKQRTWHPAEIVVVLLFAAFLVAIIYGA